MQQVINEFYGILDQIRDVFEHFNVEPIFSDEIIPNPYGGNPEYKVTFTYKAPHFEGREKVFTYHPAFTTVPGFIAEIRAYMFECVDAFVNLL